MIQKFRKIAPWLALLVYLVVTFSFISAKRHNIIVDNIAVRVIDDNNNYFVQEADVIKMLRDKNEKIVGVNIDSLDINHIEELLNHHPSVKEANVYRCLNGELRIRVEQRNPIIRVFNMYRESYYIDEEGGLMPLSGKYASHVLIANGAIKANYSKYKHLNYASPVNDSVYRHNKLLFDLYTLAKFINDDPFWKSQIEQIFVSQNKFDMVPRVGRHIIKFGNIDDYQTKFRNLKALYENGLPQAGWNNYKTINLEFKNQVICTRI